MTSKRLKMMAGFISLFVLYHTAEYFVLFRNSAGAFLCFQALFFVTAIWVARWQGYKGLGAWGLRIDKRSALQLVTGAVLGLVLYTGTFLAGLLAGSERIVSVPHFTSMIQPLLLFGFGVFFSSFSEDVLTRGYILRHFPQKAGSLLFVFLSAAIYLGNHIYRLADGLITCAYLFSLGILFAIPLWRTKRLWFTGGMHWIGNSTFFFTHSIIKTEMRPEAINPNLIFVLCIAVTIPLSTAVIGACKFDAKEQGSSGEDHLVPSLDTDSNTA